MTVTDRFDPHAGCPDAEQLAAYADGTLGPDDRAAVERHLVGCADCRAVLHETMNLAAVHPVTDAPVAPATVVPFRSRRWVTGAAAGLAVAAALVLAVQIARPDWLREVFGPTTDRPELQELIAALANEPTRPVEGRLTGGFKYAPAPSPTRGAVGQKASLQVSRAAARVEKRSEDDDTSANHAASGVALAILGELDRGIAQLERAVERSPTDDRYSSDLSALYLARAQRFGRSGDSAKALDAAERALVVRPELLEGRFNRALALEQLQRRDEAKQAWNDLLLAEPASPWADEIRAHLRALEAPPRQGQRVVLGSKAPTS